jgi:hypothetical protein
METKKFAVIGHPIGHTMSPFIHTRLFELQGVKAEYTKLDIAPENLKYEFKNTLSKLDGFNITIPHKQAVIPFLDEIDAKAEMYGSVNTVSNKNGISKGYTTDPDGFLKALDAAGISQLNVLGLVACEAAYAHGEEWYEAMHSYVADNIAFTKEYVETQLPGVSMVDHEGTYLVWLDFRETGLSVDELEDLIVHRAKLWLDSGKIFGDCGKGFQRVNVACPRATLKEALDRIKTALQEREVQ